MNLINFIKTTLKCTKPTRFRDVKTVKIKKKYIKFR